MTQGIIFDLDGTLAYTLEDIADSMNRILNMKGLPQHQYEAYKDFVGHGLKKLVTLSIHPEKRTDEFIEQCFSLMMEDYGKNYLVKTRLYEGVLELVNDLKKRGLKLAVFSNKVHDLTVKTVNGLFGENKFDFVLGAKHEFPSKPDPAGALLIAKKLGIDPKDLLYVGDSGVDMLTANRAGMYAIGAEWGYRPKDELIKHGSGITVKQPEEIFKIVLDL